MKAQVSVELLIIAAVVVAIVLIAATTLMGTAKESQQKIQEKQTDVFDALDGNLGAGKPCTANSQCSSGTCSDGKCS